MILLGKETLTETTGQTATIAMSSVANNVEEQLATIIASARNVAIVAEELLREVASQQTTTSDAGKLQHRLGVAPRLLSATEQQLESLLAMLRTY
ncbi:MAG: hypothetical protein ACRCWF_07765 [Beijerinckiaceae bacterium]